MTYDGLRVNQQEVEVHQVRRLRYLVPEESWLHCPRCYPGEELLATKHRYTTVEERWFCTRCGHRQEPTS